MYREALEQSQSYHEVIEEMETLKAKKKRIEDTIREEYQKECSDIDTLKTDIQSEQALLSDMALTEFMKGQSITITDENDQKYDPVISVKYKKS